MKDGYQKLVYQFPLSRLSISVLLALRVIFDKVDEAVCLDADVEELAQFPERLAYTYRAQWEAYVNRALVTYASDADSPSGEAMIEDILSQVHHLQESDERYQRLLGKIYQVTQPPEAVSPPWRKQLMSVLLPVTAIERNPKQ